MVFANLMKRAQSGLTQDEAGTAVRAMMDGQWNAGQIASFLTVLAKRGETAEEVAGFAIVMRDKAVMVPLKGMRVLDTCGTGGDRKNSFNISTVSAFVLAGCGIPIAKHGNKAASSACGSADLLEALGMSIRLKPEQVRDAIESSGFAFLFAPDYHPATRSVAPVRKQLGFPTIFNLLGPLTNPAEPSSQVIGVFRRSALPLMTEALSRINSDIRACLIHSVEGYDEATPTARFLVHRTFGSASLESASDFGFAPCSPEDLLGGSASKNAKIACSIMNGEPGPKRDTVLLNAILGYLAYHPKAKTDEARAAVTESVDSGAALRVVDEYRRRFPL